MAYVLFPCPTRKEKVRECVYSCPLYIHLQSRNLARFHLHQEKDTGQEAEKGRASSCFPPYSGSHRPPPPPTKVYARLLSNPRTGIGSTSAIQLSYIKSARRCNKMWRTKRSGWSPRWTGENAPFDITGRLFSSCKAPSFSPSLFLAFCPVFPLRFVPSLTPSHGLSTTIGELYSPGSKRSKGNALRSCVPNVVVQVPNVI